jgi:hypothetical protein
MSYSYQHKFTNFSGVSSNISGAISNTHSINYAKLSDSGKYSIQVTNNYNNRVRDFGSKRIVVNPLDLPIVQRSLSLGKPFYGDTLNNTHCLNCEESYDDYRVPEPAYACVSDGVDDFGTFTNNIPLNDFTISFWIKPENTGMLFGHTSSSSSLSLNTINQFFIRINSVNYTIPITLGSTGILNHISIVREGSNITCYKNGVLFSTLIASDSLYNISYLFTYSDLNIFYEGLISDLKIYSSAKNPSECFSIYENSGRLLDSENVVGWWPMNEKDGVNIYDWHGNNDIVISNADTSLGGSFHFQSSDINFNADNYYYNSEYSLAPNPIVVNSPCVTGDTSLAVHINSYEQLIPRFGDFQIDLSYFHIPGSRHTIISQGTSDAHRFRITANMLVGTDNSTNSISMQANGRTSGIINCLTPGWNRILCNKTHSGFLLTCNNENFYIFAGSGYFLEGGNTSFLRYAGNILFSAGSISDIKITMSGVTKYFPLQEGNGRDIYWYDSNNNYGVLANSIINGNTSNIWGNKTSFSPNYRVNNGGSMRSGVFIVGVPNQEFSADGSYKIMTDGKVLGDNSSINFNYFNKAENNGLGLETNYSGSIRSGVAPINTKFSRIISNSVDRLITVSSSISGSQLQRAQIYTS